MIEYPSSDGMMHTMPGPKESQSRRIKIDNTAESGRVWTPDEVRDLVGMTVRVCPDMDWNKALGKAIIHTSEMQSDHVIITLAAFSTEEAQNHFGFVDLETVWGNVGYRYHERGDPKITPYAVCKIDRKD